MVSGFFFLFCVVGFQLLVLLFLREKVCFFWYQVCQIVVEGEVEEEAKGGKGRLSRWTSVRIFASTMFLGSFVV